MARVEIFRPMLERELRLVERIYFVDSPHYMVGTALTLADCGWAPRLAMLADLIHFDLSPYPKQLAYLSHMKESEEAFKLSHKTYYEFLNKRKSRM
eukprot:NODE_7456_length_455_cov_30.204433_g6621_i0.p2 GENE.NODE_7456_length_455_cov_30.204433_g6621_i0~~NODE_7456_length_455_cov_30.204433_g6621_i0.p2  ORF type:complete len:110 (-),score=37.05 NODE_7456_length_455_cov_30.204433_g6621_i0:126-413(-)